MPEMVFEYILKQNHIDPASDLTIDQNIDFGSTAAAFAEEKADYDFTVEFEPGATNLEKQEKGYVVSFSGTTADMSHTLHSLQRKVTSPTSGNHSGIYQCFAKRYELCSISTPRKKLLR